MTKEELALFLFEQCQNRTAPVASVVQAVAEKAGVSPESIDEVVRRYKNTGVGLEETASKILGFTPDVSQIVIPQAEIISPAQAVVPSANFVIHNGVVVTLNQEKTDLNIVDGTVPELKGVPVSKDYFDQRAKELFPEATYELKNLADSINKRGQVFDLALAQALPKDDSFHARTAFLYNGVKYSGYSMQTDQEIEAERLKNENAREQQKIAREERLAEKDRLIESLGLNKFEDPEACYQLYCMLKEEDEDFTFDINLMSEEGCGNILYYNDEEYKVMSTDEINDRYYEEECEYIQDNPHEYVYDCCYGEMVERVFGYSAKSYESDDGNYYVIKE